jgi:hypothetical protein
MTPDRWRQVSHLYHAALARPEAGRDAFVRAACGEDEPLRHSYRRHPSLSPRPHQGPRAWHPALASAPLSCSA